MRPQLEAVELNRAINHVAINVFDQLYIKGFGAFASRHETLGIIQEEMDELVDAVRSEPANAVMKELVDIAVAAIIGFASMDSGKTDW